MKPTKSAALDRALLVSIRTPKIKDDEAAESLAELKRLVTTLGFRVVGSQSQRQSSTNKITVVGSGKLQELVQLTGNRGAEDYIEDEHDDITETHSVETLFELADVVVFDCDLSPAQIRHLGNALGIEVLDRTGVIIKIFSRHARTRTAKLQVEIARLNYTVPRLRDADDGGNERFMGQGTGESALEIDRRRVRDRLAELRHELVDVERVMKGRRSQRSTQFSVALVGYTNAGKSSTMRALTGSEILVEDKLFATLDTTVRALQPETQPRILVSDTVGFIKKLPHDLVASFHSTLDEARDASLLLYVVDAADPGFRSQLQVVNEVLEEIGVEDIPKLLLLNKSDQLSDDQKKSLMEEFPDAVMMSSRNPADIELLHERIVTFSESDMQEEELLVPYTAKGVIGEIRANMRVLKEDYDQAGIRLQVRSGELELRRVKKMLEA
jgi:GTPase